MRTDNQSYFVRRAAEERAAAEKSGCPKAAEAHREMAQRYSMLADVMAGEPIGEVRAESA
jgi:hypothetical protein